MGCKMRPTMEEMVNEVLQWLEKSSEEERLAFKNCPEEKLIFYHRDLGCNIRNHFRLWEYEWEKVIVDGIDHSPTHPDNLAFSVIKEIHRKVQ